MAALGGSVVPRGRRVKPCAKAHEVMSSTKAFLWDSERVGGQSGSVVGAWEVDRAPAVEVV